MEFCNTTIFIMPVSVGSGQTLERYLQATGLWERPAQREVRCEYLLNYAARLSGDQQLCKYYRYRDPDSLNIYCFERELGLEQPPRIVQIQLCAFGTGVAFLEVQVAYDDLPVDQIIDFAYLFKKVTRADGKRVEKGDKVSLFTAACKLLPLEESSARLFFANTTVHKYQCLCLHLLRLDAQTMEQRGEELMFALKRSYNSGFLYGQAGDESDYDMSYSPYSYIRWGGCQEGLVCMTCPTGNEDTDYFVEHFYFGHLLRDYHYMYLLLLNQRFSALRYITEIADARDELGRVEEVNAKAIDLKTRYSFHVISDELSYQNIYTRMYRILDVDKLLYDIEENGQKLTAMQNQTAVESEKMTEKFLMGISLLSLFSALVDAAGYFDRVPVLRSAATLVSFFCVSGIAVLCLAMLIWGRVRRKRRGTSKKRTKNKRES